MIRETIPHLLGAAAQGDPEAITLYHPNGAGGFKSLSSRAQTALVDAYTAALHAWGIKHGDRVAILSSTRYEWALMDRAILQMGGIVVGIYPTSSAEQCAYILNHSESRIIVLEDARQLQKLAGVEIPLAEKRVLIDEEGAAAGSWFSLLTMQQIGEAKLEDEPHLIPRLLDSVQPDDIASLVYTSGTTGPPKGVVLRHHNLYATAKIVADYMHVSSRDISLSYLPMAHIMQRVNNYIGGAANVTGYYIKDVLKLIDECKRIGPTTISSVPRVYEKVHAGVMASLAKAPAWRRELFYKAFEVGKQRTELLQRGAEIPFLLNLKWRFYERLIFQKIRAALFGKRIQYITSGAAPLSLELLQFFHAIGLPLYESYGLTETCAPFTLNRAEEFRLGTVGPALPGSEMKIAADGEILLRGPGVFNEYYKNPEATAEAIDDEGWFHSGDIGEIDADRFLRITDRKKNILITAGGKNVAPANIELMLLSSQYINQVMIYGDRRKYLVAIVTLDEDAILHWAERNAKGELSLPDLVRDDAVKQLVQAEVDLFNSKLAQFETIKYFHIAPEEFTVANGMPTPTLKLKRRVVCDVYADDLERLYDPSLAASTP